MVYLREMLATKQGLVRDYLSLVGGSAGRLVFSLAYFVALANTLSISDFGLFATASAAGVMLSRVVGFGFVSPLYRVATVRPQLVGVYTAGFILMSALSLPVVAAGAVAAYLLFFDGLMAAPLFALVIVAEAILWRSAEVVVIVNNGMNLFGRGAVMTVLGTVFRAAAAVVFAFVTTPDLAAWCWFYLGANALSLSVALLFFYPGGRLRLKPRLYGRRMRDALSVAGADMLFYVQMELDKLLVLALGGPALAGIYAIVMRLVDLTAVPIRAFSTMLVQRMMRAPNLLARIPVRIAIESGIFAVSTLALAVLAGLLHVQPGLLGRQVAEAAPIIGLALFVPALRNLVEYQAELLYARGQTLLRANNLALLAGLKAMLLAQALVRIGETPDLIYALNWVFAAIYLASALLTYSAIRLPARALAGQSWSD